MKGYLFVQTVADFERERADVDYDELEKPSTPSSLEGRGWMPISRAIKDEDFLKVSAERHGSRHEVRFNTKVNKPKGNNGSCEIHGGPLACTGTIVNVRPGTNSQFKEFYVCHSSSGDGKHFLRWQIGVNEFVDADAILNED